MRNRGSTATGSAPFSSIPFVSRDIDAISHDVVSVGGMFIGTTKTAPAIVSASGSPFTHTNTSGRIEVVYISAGTVSAVAVVRNGTSVTVFATTNVTVTLLPNDVVTITYTVAPTIHTEML